MAKMETTDCDVTIRWRLTKPTNIQLHEAKFLWFVQKRSLGLPISSPILSENALEIN